MATLLKQPLCASTQIMRTLKMHQIGKKINFSDFMLLFEEGKRELKKSLKGKTKFSLWSYKLIEEGKVTEQRP